MACKYSILRPRVWAPVITGFVIDLTHHSKPQSDGGPGKPAWFSILDLMPNGEIAVLWPPRDLQGEDNVITPGAIHRLGRRGKPVIFKVVEPTGVDTLKLFASDEPYDFSPVRSRGSDAAPVISGQGINAYSVTIEVVDQ